MQAHINREALEGYFQNHRSTLLHKDDVVAAIANAPECEVVEVVRCKDCKFRYTQTCFAKHETSDSDYCCNGLRKDG